MESFQTCIEKIQTTTYCRRYVGKVQDLRMQKEHKAHLRHSQLDLFPKNLHAVSKEQSERFLQDIKEMGRQYQ